MGKVRKKTTEGPGSPETFQVRPALFSEEGAWTLPHLCAGGRDGEMKAQPQPPSTQQTWAWDRSGHLLPICPQVS